MTPEEMATRLNKMGEEIGESIEWLTARTDAEISPKAKKEIEARLYRIIVTYCPGNPPLEDEKKQKTKKD